MTDVQFEENPQEAITTNNDSFKSRALLGQPETPAMIRFLVSHGIVKSERTAGYILLALSFVFFLLMAFVMAVFVFDVNLRALTGTAGSTKNEFKEQLNIDLSQVH